MPKIPDFEVRTPNFEFRHYPLSHKTPLIIPSWMTTHSPILPNAVPDFEVRTPSSTFDIIRYPTKLLSLSPLEWVLFSTPIPNAENPDFEVRLSNFDLWHYPLSIWSPLIIPSWMTTHSPLPTIPENPGFRSNFELLL